MPRLTSLGKLPFASAEGQLRPRSLPRFRMAMRPGENRKPIPAHRTPRTPGETTGCASPVRTRPPWRSRQPAQRSRAVSFLFCPVAQIYKPESRISNLNSSNEPSGIRRHLDSCGLERREDAPGGIYPMGEKQNQPFQLLFNAMRKLKVQIGNSGLGGYFRVADQM